MSDFPTIEACIGQTPLVRLQRLDCGTSTVLLKLEGNNPAGSVKDRAALNMIIQAELRQEISLVIRLLRQRVVIQVLRSRWRRPSKDTR